MINQHEHRLAGQHNRGDGRRRWQGLSDQERADVAGGVRGAGYLALGGLPSFPLLGLLLPPSIQLRLLI
jgi:hypothetical protein